MRLLFLTPYAPTPIRTRPFNFLRALARRGHDITLATVWENEGERAALKEMAALGIHVLAEPLTRTRKLQNLAQALLAGEPLQAHYSWQPALARTLSTLLTTSQSQLRNPQSSILPPFDIIHIEHLRGARYGLFLKSAIRNPQSPSSGMRSTASPTSSSRLQFAAPASKPVLSPASNSPAPVATKPISSPSSITSSSPPPPTKPPFSTLALTSISISPSSPTASISPTSPPATNPAMRPRSSLPAR